MITILIPTYNNLDYLKLCIKSIKNNSSNKYRIILHINEGTDGTLNYAVENNLEYTFSKTNIGLSASINTSSKLVKTKYILYAHDDMYFCPEWDIHLINEINKIGHDKFYLSAVLIGYLEHIKFNCGYTHKDFDEKPWFVIGKDMHNNILIVTQNETELMYQGEIKIDEINWVHKVPSQDEYHCMARFRHGGKLVPIKIYPKENKIILCKSERAVTPGQSAVFYDGDKCLGGGIIRKLCSKKI